MKTAVAVHTIILTRVTTTLLPPIHTTMDMGTGTVVASPVSPTITTVAAELVMGTITPLRRMITDRLHVGRKAETAVRVEAAEAKAMIRVKL